jgi:hypothetical protein
MVATYVCSNRNGSQQHVYNHKVHYHVVVAMTSAMINGNGRLDGKLIAGTMMVVENNHCSQL